MKSKLIRVPCEFDYIVSRLAKKRGYRHKTDFLKNEGTRLFNHADMLTDFFDEFRKIKKQKVRGKIL